MVADPETSTLRARSGAVSPFARPRRRLASLALLVVHLLAGFAALAADARAEDGSGVAHLEAAADASCASGHDHATCQFCRLLGSAPDPVQRYHAGDGPTRVATAAPAGEDRVAAASLLLSVGPRAPPLD